MNAAIRELTLATRALWRAPLFATVAIASLAVGIGANVAVFSLGNALLFRSVGVPAADRLVRVGRGTGDIRFGAISFPEYRDLRDALSSSAELVAHYPTRAVLTSADGPRSAWLEIVSGNYFTALAVRPAHGRAFTAGETRTQGASPVVVISDRLWRTRFAADSGVVGRTIRLNGRAFTVVGVAPATFRGTFTGFAIDAWVPVTMQAVVAPGAGSLQERDDRFLMLLAVRRPGVDAATLGVTLAAVAPRLQAAQREPREVVRLEMGGAGGVHPFVARLVRAFMALLQTIVLLVLVIACVNLASVSLVRASARARELSVRAALGATRWRLARVALTEAAVIAALGGIAGTVIAVLLGRVIERLDLPVGIPLSLTLGLDAKVLAVAVGMTAITAAVFGAGPALAASRSSALANLRVAGATTDRTRARVRTVLVVVQVAVATVLLVGSGLAVRSLRESALLRPGFTQAGVHLLSASPDLLGYDEERGRALWHTIAERATRVQGVERASLALFVPLGSRGDRLAMAPGREAQSTRPFPYNIVSPGYFDVLRIPLVVGRDLLPNDDGRAADVVVVSEAMARQFFGTVNAVGRTIRVADRAGRARHATIVGVVGDIKLRSMGEAPAAIAYLPFGQWYRPDMVLHARVATGAERVIPRVVEQIRGIEPDLAVDVESLARATEFSMIPLRVASVVLGFCGAVGALLAAFGVFGLVAYAVSLRTREIGIRVALGADWRAVSRLVALHAWRPVGVGLLLGTMLSFGAGGALRGLLVGVRPNDPATLGAAIGLLLAAAAAALIVPLRHALAIDPARVLRQE